MPNFEAVINETESYGSYDKIISFFRYGTDTSNLGRQNRVSVNIRSSDDYEFSFAGMTDSQYRSSAGCDLAALLMPFETRKGGSGLPGFDSSVRADASGTSVDHYKLLPFNWEPNESGYVYNRLTTASGDSINYLISDTEFRGSVNKYRDISNIRAIGFRLPMMAVGWGYTLSGDPWPSGGSSSGVGPDALYPSGTKFFKGHTTAGWEVDPADYVAAPIDFRYDTSRNVWTCGAPEGFWAEITQTSGYPISPSYLSGSFTVVSGTAHAWREVIFGASGVKQTKSGGLTGTLQSNYAFEVNNLGAPVGTVVWMHYKTNNHFYSFELPIPRHTLGIGKWAVLSIVDDNYRVGWDYTRFK